MKMWELWNKKFYWYKGVADDLHMKGMITPEGKALMYSWARHCREESDRLKSSSVLDI